LTVSRVAVLNVTLFTVIPVPEMATVAPLTNPDPVMLTVPVNPCGREPGVTVVGLGAAATVKPLFLTRNPPSGLVIVTTRPPVAAFGSTSMLRLIWLGLTTVTLFTVIPLPENATAAPTWKEDPVITMS
jgi:hypothetical protein